MKSKIAIVVYLIPFFIAAPFIERAFENPTIAFIAGTALVTHTVMYPVVISMMSKRKKS